MEKIWKKFVKFYCSIFCCKDEDILRNIENKGIYEVYILLIEIYKGF